ncbi:four-jointed box protein 1-like [Ruditapes philippinarum]|uniref:four-jointed box protein 1-like n=1 Tax=Ruditapes philippinarum TaxID=129788 RepID=UPI00295B6B32|nr:four-jointed box protein 1-like [Ruditapes philippinarum]
MPPVITNAYKTGNPVTSNIITQYTKPLLSKPHAVAELIQWGTIIVFDNLIGHYDRLVLYQSIGPLGNSRRSLERGLYNSLKSPNGKLWLIDNESAFFYQSKYQGPIYKYTQLLKFNDRMLQTVCIFQSSLVAELRRLSRQPSAFHYLFDFAGSYEPLLANVILDPRFELFAKIFNTRLGQILEWVEHCQTLYNAT